MHHHERQRGRELREFVAGDGQHVGQPLPRRLTARVGELVHRPLRELLVALGVANRDQAGRLEAIDRAVQVGALADVHDLVLAPQLHEALQAVGVERPDFEQAQHGQAEGPWAWGRGHTGHLTCSAATSHEHD